MKVTLYTDGASRGNPGQAGLGVVIYAEDGQKIARYEYLGITTTICRISLIRVGRSKVLGATEVGVFTDSELMAANKWTIQVKCRTYTSKIKELFSMVMLK